MKKIYLTLLSCFIAIVTMAQTPGFSYQAIILNPDVQSLPGNDVEQELLSESDIAIRFTIENELGTEYQETHTTKTDAYGMVSLMVGQGMATIGNFTEVAWVGAAKYLKVEIDFTASGGSYESLDRQIMTYLPQPMSNESMAIIDQINSNVSDNSNSILAEQSRATASEQANASLINSLTECGLSIGDSFQGGIIFYLDASGCHGLVAKATDEGAYQWSSEFIFASSLVSGIYGGAQNTKKIIAKALQLSVTSPAASVCDNLISGGYSDWYLPSKDELDMMYVNLHMQGWGGFLINNTPNNYNYAPVYWSSTETPIKVSYSVWAQIFGDVTAVQTDSTYVNSGLIDYELVDLQNVEDFSSVGNKDLTFNVRAIRAF